MDSCASLTLLTDLYQLTMAQSYFKQGLADRQAVFHLFFRRQPFGGNYAIAAGLESAANYIKNFHFSEDDIAYLGSLKDAVGSALFAADFLVYLKQMKITCDLDAVPEGTAVFPQEPLLRVKGPIIQAQLLESALLNLINFPTLIATKASRICRAAEGDLVVEFGMRRAQGPDGALTAARAAYIGGCKATSNVLAGKLYGIPVKGTHAHSWVMAFDDEQEAFDAWAEAMPTSAIFLIDTYNTLEGIKKAIASGKKLRAKGHELLAVRLDSGDLAYLSIQIRQMLDEQGFSNTQIMASNELDEQIIQDLKRQGAKITIWGVGTHLVTGSSQPALDGVYKLSALEDAEGVLQDKLKISEEQSKSSNPGILQVRRFKFGPFYRGDMIYDVTEELSTYPEAVQIRDPTICYFFSPHYEQKDLLVPIFRAGKLVYTHPTLHAMQQLAKEELAHFDPRMLRFLNPEPYHVGFSKEYFARKAALVKKIRGI